MDRWRSLLDREGSQDLEGRTGPGRSSSTSGIIPNSAEDDRSKRQQFSWTRAFGSRRLYEVAGGSIEPTAAPREGDPPDAAVDRPAKEGGSLLPQAAELGGGAPADGLPAAEEKPSPSPGERGAPASSAGGAGIASILVESLSRHKERRLRGTRAQARKFLVNLASALHTYGSSAARTEYLVEKVGQRLRLHVSVAVFPSLILLSFGEEAPPDIASRETVLLTIAQDLDVDKLGRVDELARNVGQEKHELVAANWQLRAIASAPSTFNGAYRLAAFFLMSLAACPLFFGGSVRDTVLAGLLGLLCGLVELWAARHSAVATSVLEFVAAIVAAVVARLVVSFTPTGTVCFYPVVMSAVVWFLPGLSLTLGVNELVAKTFVAGSSHVIASIFSAFQLGFGIVVGESLVFWDQKDIHHCAPVQPLPVWAKLLWFAAYTATTNVLINARRDQWAGMALVSLVGYAVSELSASLGNEASSIIAAFAVSIAGTFYSRTTAQFPLAAKVAGILVLVPGGVGVSGVAALLEDSSSGTIFVFEMLMVALSITLGLLLGKILFPEGLYGYSGRTTINKASLSASFQAETGLEEEDMAF